MYYTVCGTILVTTRKKEPLSQYKSKKMVAEEKRQECQY